MQVHASSHPTPQSPEVASVATRVHGDTLRRLGEWDGSNVDCQLAHENVAMPKSYRFRLDASCAKKHEQGIFHGLWVAHKPLAIRHAL